MMESGTVAILATSMGGFATTMGTLLYQGWSRARERRWDAEDRERIAAEEAVDRARIGAEHTRLIEANTALTQVAAEKADAAYVEANNVNEKLKALGRTVPTSR